MAMSRQSKHTFPSSVKVTKRGTSENSQMVMHVVFSLIGASPAGVCKVGLVNGLQPAPGY